MKLSAHFSLTEFTKSQTAERKGIDNTPDDNHIEAMEQLCHAVLEEIRYHFQKPMVINSGYRSPALCEAIGSKSTSQHAKGQAADIEIPGVDNLKLAQYIQDKMEYSSMIMNLGVRYDAFVPSDSSISNLVYPEAGKGCEPVPPPEPPGKPF